MTTDTEERHDNRHRAAQPDHGAPRRVRGKPIIRDMRIAVEHVLGMLAAGDSTETILSEYDFLEEEDIRACLLFAHRSLAGEQVYDRTPIRQAE